MSDGEDNPIYYVFEEKNIIYARNLYVRMRMKVDYDLPNTIRTYRKCIYTWYSCLLLVRLILKVCTGSSDPCSCLYV